MSAYTDIKNRIKENIAANMEDRTVSARVEFLNQGNIYRGTFIGDVTASSLVVPDEFFDNMSFSRSILVNPVLSSFSETDEDGIQTAKLDFSDLQSVSCAVRNIKYCLLSRFPENDPSGYTVADLASAFIDLKHCLSGF